MSGRIVLFGATGLHGRSDRPGARRPRRPPGARRPQPPLASTRSPPSSAGSRRGSPTSPAPRRLRGLVERGDVLVSTVGPFARWGEPAGRGRDRRRRALPRLDRRAAVHPRGLRALRAGRRGGRLRAADRVRLRLGPRQPRGRARPARGGRATPTRVDIGYFVTGDAGAGAERRHARVGGRALLAPALRVPRRAARHRARRRAHAQLRPRRRARGRGSRSGRPRRSRCRGCTPACATSTSTWAGPVAVARRCRRVGGLVAARPRPGAAATSRGARRAARQGLDRRPRCRGAGQERLARRRRGLRRRGTQLAEVAAARRQRLRLHRPHPRLGRASAPPRAACRAPARSARSDGFGLDALAARRAPRRASPRLTQAALRDPASPGARGDHSSSASALSPDCLLLTPSPEGTARSGPGRDMHALIHRALSPQTVATPGSCSRSR